MSNFNRPYSAPLSPGRITNAPTFDLTSLEGNCVAELLGATDSDSDELIEMLFLRLVDDNQWYRMFLNAGIGFWEKWTKEEAFREYEDDRLIDFAARWQLVGSKIIFAKCVGGTWDDLTLSSFKLVMEKGTLNFAFIDLQDMESETVISFTPDNEV